MADVDAQIKQFIKADRIRKDKDRELVTVFEEEDSKNLTALNIEYGNDPAAPALAKTVKKAMGVDYEIRPTRYDPRFPNQNQTVHCWQYYVDYFKCAKELANEDPSKQRICDQFQNAYRMLCPASWVNKWDEQRENGIFPADINE